MSCQCHTIGGPFIAEDPECIIHGYAAKDRENFANNLHSEAENTNNIVRLKEIITTLVKKLIDLD